MADTELIPGEHLTAPTVTQLLLNAGFTQDQANNFTKIAYHESGYDAGILNDTPATGDYSVGLFQINYYGSLGASRSAEFGTPTALAANPQAQAEAAKTLFDQSGYSPWQADINAGVLNGAILAGGGGGPSGTGGTSGATFQAAATAFGKLLQQIDGFYNPTVTIVPSWLNIFGGSAANSSIASVLSVVDRAIGVLAGAGLVYIGIRLLTSGNSGGKPSVVGTAVRAVSNVRVAETQAGARLFQSQSRERIASSQGEQAAAQAAADRQYKADRDAQRQAEADKKYQLEQQKLSLREREEQRRERTAA